MGCKHSTPSGSGAVAGTGRKVKQIKRISGFITDTKTNE